MHQQCKEMEKFLCKCLIGCSLSDCVSVKLKKKCEQTNQPLRCNCLCDLDRLTWGEYWKTMLHVGDGLAIWWLACQHWPRQTEGLTRVGAWMTLETGISLCQGAKQWEELKTQAQENTDGVIEWHHLGVTQNSGCASLCGQPEQTERLLFTSVMIQDEDPRSKGQFSHSINPMKVKTIMGKSLFVMRSVSHFFVVWTV